MIKIILIVIGILLAAGGGYYFLSKPIQIAIQLQQPSGSKVSPEVPPVFLPVSGTTITIQNCKADPYMLEISEGTEITINNTDDQAHTLFIAGPNTEVKLPAGGSTKIVAKFSQGHNFTYNYLCDQQGYPSYGGAIFVTP